MECTKDQVDIIFLSKLKDMDTKTTNYKVIDSHQQDGRLGGPSTYLLKKQVNNYPVTKIAPEQNEEPAATQWSTKL